MPFKKGQKAWNKGIPMSREQKIKVSIAKTGKKQTIKREYRPLSDEHKRKLSIIMKGKKFPFRKRSTLSQETKDKIGKANRGKKRSPETRAKIKEKRKFQIITEETKEKLRQRQLNCSIEYRKKVAKGIKRAMLEGRHSGYKGGITKKSILIRESFRMKLAKNKCFIRDSYTCRSCNKRGGTLNAHHIKSFAKYPKLRFTIKNLMTLCLNCHKKTYSYSRNIN